MNWTLAALSLLATSVGDIPCGAVLICGSWYPNTTKCLGCDGSPVLQIQFSTWFG